MAALNRSPLTIPSSTSVASAAALTAVAAAGATPTKAEFDALLADVTEVRAQPNVLIAALTS